MCRPWVSYGETDNADRRTGRQTNGNASFAVVQACMYIRSELTRCMMCITADVLANTW